MSTQACLTREIFKGTIPFLVDSYSYDNFEALQMHCHDFIEIVYVRKGRGFHVFGNQRQVVSKGDLFIINIDTPHCFYPNDPSNCDGLEVFNCMFMPEFIEDMNIKAELLLNIINMFLYKSIYTDEIEHAPDLKLSGKHMIQIEALYEEMLLEYTQEEEGYDDILKLLLSKLLIIIFRAYKKVTAASHDFYRQKLIYHSLDYLHENYKEKLNLDLISKHALLSKSYYSTLFKKIIGISVFDYIQKLRIDNACQLLADTDSKITDIALSIGYTNYRFFNKTFKKLKGMTALEYRKKIRQQ